MEREADRQWLAMVVVAIFVLKLTFALAIAPRFSDRILPLYGIGRADNYHSIAKNIDAGRGYRFTPETSLTLMREPGYPYFLAGLLRVFDNDREPAVVANIVFTSLAAIVLGYLARSVTGVRWVPVAAPLLFMLHPGVILSELRNSVESLFTLLVLVFLSLLLKALRTGKTLAYVEAGFALGIASCVRSTALLFPAFLILHGLILKGGWASVVRAAWRAALVLACALIALSPWIVRNEMLVGKFIPTATVQGIAMQAGEYICIHEGEKDMDMLDLDAATARNRLAAEQGYRFEGEYYQFFYDPKDELKFSNALAQQVVHDYSRSPALFAKCTSENVLKFWFAGKTRAVTIANLCIQLPYLLLALWGVTLEFRRMDRSALTLLLLFVAYTVTVYAPIHAQARYSMVLVPILSLFAAVPICRWLVSRSREPDPTAAPPHTSE
jgi:4-amino-4-deoxy-L-arabinose transferase-like glycosyltransferase